MKNNTRQNHNSFNTDRDRDRDVDGGGFYAGHPTGSPLTNISSPTSSFYNLQMYSTPSLYTTPVSPVSANAHNHHQIQPSSNNLYKSVQEVPYHPQVDPRAYPIRSTPSPSASMASSSSSGTVHKNGITFVDPFSNPVITPSNDNYYNQNQQLQQQQQQPQHYNQGPLNNNNLVRNNNNNNNINTSTSSYIRTSYEPVSQPIYATFGTESIFVTCPYCHNTDSTEIEQRIGSKSLLWAYFIPCAGFLIKSKWDTLHRCKNCINVIGIYYP